MKLVDQDGSEFLTPNALSVENEAECPLIHVNFEASSFEAQEEYQLVLMDTDSGRVMTADLYLKK